MPNSPIVLSDKTDWEASDCVFDEQSGVQTPAQIAAVVEAVKAAILVEFPEVKPKRENTAAELADTLSTFN